MMQVREVLLGRREPNLGPRNRAQSLELGCCGCWSERRGCRRRLSHTCGSRKKGRSELLSMGVNGNVEFRSSSFVDINFEILVCVQELFLTCDENISREGKGPCYRRPISALRPEPCYAGLL